MRDDSKQLHNCVITVAIITLVALCAVASTPQTPFPATSDQDPNLPSLVAEAAKGGAMHRLLSDYTCRMKVTFKDKDQGRATERTRTYGMYVHEANRRYKRARVLIEENGRPIPADNVEKERKGTGRELDQSGQDATRLPPAESAPETPAKYAIWTYKERAPFGRTRAITVGISEVLERCELDSPRRERLNDRDVIAVSFRPTTSAPPDAFSYLTKVRGVVWIDVVDKVVVRIEARPTNTAESGSDRTEQAAPAIVYDQLRTKEGAWVPRLIRINGGDYPDLFGVQRDIVAEFSDYWKFTVDAKEGPTSAPKNRPWNR